MMPPKMGKIATRKSGIKSEKVTPIMGSHGHAEKRFEELEALYKKGVITEDEYKKTRERILNEL